MLQLEFDLYLENFKTFILSEYSNLMNAFTELLFLSDEALDELADLPPRQRRGYDLRETANLRGLYQNEIAPRFQSALAVLDSFTFNDEGLSTLNEALAQELRDACYLLAETFENPSDLNLEAIDTVLREIVEDSLTQKLISMVCVYARDNALESPTENELDDVFVLHLTGKPIDLQRETIARFENYVEGLSPFILRYTFYIHRALEYLPLDESSELARENYLRFIETSVLPKAHEALDVLRSNPILADKGIRAFHKYLGDRHREMLIYLQNFRYHYVLAEQNNYKNIVTDFRFIHDVSDTLFELFQAYEVDFVHAVVPNLKRLLTAISTLQNQYPHESPLSVNLDVLIRDRIEAVLNM